MNFGVNAIVALIKLALFIGVAGGLVDLTIQMRNEAVQAHKTGLVNLRTLNHSLDKESPFVNKHHQNWRFQAIQQMERRRDEDIFFTSPMSLSKEAAEEIRKLLPNFIQSIMKISGPSPSEIATCLNIDWFEY